MATENGYVIDGDTITLTGLTQLPKNIDIDDFKNINIVGCDFSDKKIKFPQDCNLSISDGTILHKKTDFMRCQNLTITNCDLSNQDKFEFHSTHTNNKTVERNLNICASKLPNDTTLLKGYESGLNQLNIDNTDLSNIPDLKLAANEITISNTSKISNNALISAMHNLTVDNCDISNTHNVYCAEKTNLINGTKIADNFPFKHGLEKLTLENVDISNVKELSPSNSYRGSNIRITISGNTNLPQNTNLSRCTSITVDKTDLSSLPELNLQPRCSNITLKNNPKLPDNIKFASNPTFELYNTDIRNMDLSSCEGLLFIKLDENSKAPLIENADITCMGNMQTDINKFQNLGYVDGGIGDNPNVEVDGLRNDLKNQRKTHDFKVKMSKVIKPKSNDERLDKATDKKNKQKITNISTAIRKKLLDTLRNM